MTLSTTLTIFSKRLKDVFFCKDINRLHKARPTPSAKESQIFQCHYISTIYEEEEESEPLLAKDENRNTLTVASSVEDDEKYMPDDLWCDESQHERHNRRCSSKIPLHTLLAPHASVLESKRHLDSTTAADEKFHVGWEYDIHSLQEDYNWWSKKLRAVGAQGECLRQELAELSCKRRNRWPKELNAWFKRKKNRLERK